MWDDLLTDNSRGINKILNTGEDNNNNYKEMSQEVMI